jgi:hypothetical protein
MQISKNSLNQTVDMINITYVILLTLMLGARCSVLGAGCGEPGVPFHATLNLEPCTQHPATFSS